MEEKDGSFHTHTYGMKEWEKCPLVNQKPMHRRCFFLGGLAGRKGKPLLREGGGSDGMGVLLWGEKGFLEK